MKKTIGIIIFILLCLSGGFWILAVGEDIKGYIYRKEKAIRAEKMRKDLDEMVKLINGSKKIKMVKA